MNAEADMKAKNEALREADLRCGAAQEAFSDALYDALVAKGDARLLEHGRNGAIPLDKNDQGNLVANSFELTRSQHPRLYQLFDGWQTKLAKAKELRQVAHAAIDAYAGSHRNGMRGGAITTMEDGATLGAAPWTLTAQGLADLHASWETGRFGRTGIQATATWADPTSIEHSGLLIGLAQEPTRIANMIPVRVTEAMRVEYFKQTGRADSAAAVASGGAKPESSPSWDRFYADVVKVAHFGRIKDEVIKDYAEWRTVVGSAYVNGLISEENRQLLLGDGSGEDMVGLVHTPDILTVVRDTTNEARLEALHRGITALRNGEVKTDATLMILHPNDYEQALFEKATGSGEYLAGNPLGMDTPSLWNVPVALTTDMTEGLAIVSNLAAGARIHWREAPIFEVHPGGGGETEWSTNMTLVRAEERLVLTVERPEAVCLVDLDG